jgi:thioester reductase-like protein
LGRCGAGDLADELDVNVLQRLTVREVVALFDRLDGAGGVRPGDLEQAIRAMRRHVDDATRVAMVADAAVVPPTINSDRVVISAEPDLETSVLITGATGSFGPYLLQQLLQRTPHRFTVLVRAAGDEAASERLSSAISATGLMDRRLRSQLRQRVTAIAGDVAQPRLGLTERRWSSLADSVDGIVHNAAAVNYLSDYAALRECNVEGTRRLLRLAAEGRPTRFDYISTTFVFGWSRQPMLLESDTNAEMCHLTFGYAQSKWVAEQLVRRAAAGGLDVRIFRPSLISPLTAGDADMADVAVRVLSFMIKYGVAPTTTNQLSVLPADVAAANIAALIGLAEPGGRTYHVTADDYYNIVDLTASMSRQFGFAFEYHPVPTFVALMNELCDRSDPLFPLLSFFTRSSADIAAMQFKRYGSETYRAARERVEGRPEPRLDAVAAHLAARVMEGGWATMPAAIRN